MVLSDAKKLIAAGILKKAVSIVEYRALQKQNNN
jgi:ribosomal protein S7